mmetsp:Transcript_14559/g.27801  ORF Transcript_14559/g.27801 Transcript_14559/m.27801 type:complete len:90 (-) Transcript_14559:906-1175(-)
MACPEAEDEAAVFDGFFVTEPVSHDGSSNGPSSRLKESKQKVHRNDKEVSERQAEAQKVEPERDVNQEQTGSASEKTNRQYGGGVEGIA